VSRDCLREDEVHPYPQGGVDEELVVEGEPCATDSDCREVSFDSLDMLELGAFFLLLAAEEKAREIIADAETEAERIRQEAAREGAALGQNEVRQQVLPSLVAFANAGQALIVFEERLISCHTAQLVRLALDISEKIIQKAVSEDPQIVASTLERAKQEVTNAKRIRISLHPKDVEMLREMRPDLLNIGENRGRTIEVLAAEEVDRGGCRLETEMGIIDATIPVQIQEVRRQLLDEASSKLNPERSVAPST
jgi:flagellar biosynthesis/type III secretory pathway protein FliH